jgi:hypothetical protein
MSHFGSPRGLPIFATFSLILCYESDIIDQSLPFSKEHLKEHRLMNSGNVSPSPIFRIVHDDIETEVRESSLSFLKINMLTSPVASNTDSPAKSTNKSGFVFLMKKSLNISPFYLSFSIGSSDGND